MWETVLLMLTKMFSFAEKVVPSDKLREQRHEDNKPKLSAKQFKGLYDDEYRRLKNHPEIDIATDVDFVNGALSPEDRIELIKLLTARIKAYRERHPIIFRKWLKEQKEADLKK